MRIIDQIQSILDNPDSPPEPLCTPVVEKPENPSEDPKKASAPVLTEVVKAAEEKVKIESLARIDAEADRQVNELIERERTNAVDQAFEAVPAGFDLARFYANHLLFGHDPEPGIVAVEAAGRNSVVEYVRAPDGSTLTRRTTFRPFIWERPEGSSRLKPRFLSGWNELTLARNWVRHQLIIWNPVDQYLISTGRTSFKGMQFSDLRRMQLDIETDCSPGYIFSHADRDRILAIALSDSSGWDHLIVAENPESEASALQELTTIIASRDPEAVEGHNLFKFDLPYLMARAAKLGVKLTWGRDGSELFWEVDHRGAPRLNRFKVGGRYLEYPALRIRGRHIIDTFLMSKARDAITHEFEDCGLKTVAKVLGVSDPNRVILEAGEIQEAYHHARNRFAAYALADVRDTRGVSAVLSPSYFVQAQIYPVTYQDLFVLGSATKTNRLLLREYLRLREPIPIAPPKPEFAGALCEIHESGIIADVEHCDVASLYPSVMLEFGCVPKSDNLGVFARIVRDLRDYRLTVKVSSRNAVDPLVKAELSALQGAFKILINSAYGYLGTPKMEFADGEAAAMVTAIGRNILTRMRDWLTAQGAKIIELDTDGIYYVLPPGVSRKELASGLRTRLPSGITVEFDKRFPVMFSYARKNAAFLTETGELLIKGGSLRSSSQEPFLRQYIETVLLMLLTDRPSEVSALYDETVAALLNHEFPLSALLKTETLNKPIAEYEDRVATGLRSRSSSYEVAIVSDREYLAGDVVDFYVTTTTPGRPSKGPNYARAKLAPDGKGYVRDEDCLHYIKKLNDVAERFDQFAPGRIPWKPKRVRKKSKGVQPEIIL